MSIPLKTQNSQDKDLSRNKTSLKQMPSSARGNDYTPREGLKLPSPLRVKNYLRIKKPNSIAESSDKNYEESKFPTVNFTSMASAVKQGEEKFRQTTLSGTSNKFRGSSHVGFGSGEPRITAYATVLQNDKNYESILKDLNINLDSASTFNVQKLKLNK